MDGGDVNVFAGILSVSLAKYVFAWWAQRSSQNFKLVGRVSGLYLHPVKSCKGIDLLGAECTKLGLKVGDVGDRQWMVIRKDETFVSIREEPSMVFIEVSIQGNCLHLDAPGMETLKVPVHMPLNTTDVRNCIMRDMRCTGLDCGQKAADWMNRYLKKDGMRLVYCHPSLSKREMRTKKTYFPNRSRPGDQALYPDFSAFLLMSEASVKNVNSNLPEGKEVYMRTFRPNIVVSGCHAFAEDSWQRVRIGNNQFVRLKHCQRCIMTTVNPETGIKDPDNEPLKSMSKYRQHPDFRTPVLGINLAADVCGPISVGDPVYAVLSD
ncbi:mitochondrial amidoxime reducing component 2-like [Lingula anatina]|uniref:Mitochondrial amidoxime reducing component 2-like n=1 Tax=Lingula anatina TaxID=7574 RepID=A0A1S3K3E2_LINAN|nr:mitochondrial amidoxime reducing component 2-like [Lingula anatina]|eukprot:XP_013416781.1 mitochondrial amidoxime reducing component 2-like [Lingula anatina]